MMKRLLLVFITFVSVQCFAQVPSQFIAKQYTEALGRAPDSSGWQGATNHAITYGCSLNTLNDLALNVFNSSEYTSKAYIPEERVLTAHRAILSRDPDSVGFSYWVERLKAGISMSDFVRSLTATSEFAGLIPAICNNPFFDPAVYSAPLAIDNNVWTQAQLQTCLQNNTVCSIPPRTLVRLTSTVTIPAGKTLQTAGGIDRKMYARQARIVRASVATPGILLLMQPGSRVENVWLTGGRDNPQFVESLTNAGSPIANVYPNVNYVGGNYGIIRGVRSDAALSATHISTYPFPYPEGIPSATQFNGIATIDNNLTTGYAHRHYGVTTPVSWADGISNHINNVTIVNNDIVDPTDVGVIIFGHSNGVQSSTARNNTIVHAGHSAYGSIGLDTTNCNSTGYATCRFSGSGFTDNTIFAGKRQHSDIMLLNGTGAWLPTNCGTTGNTNCGTGGQMSGNRTILGDGNQVVPVQIAIHVDGMLNAVTSGNALSVGPIDAASIQPGAQQNCFKGSMIVNGRPLRASGSLQAGADAYVVPPCINH